MKTRLLIAGDEDALTEVVQVLQQDELAAFPTDTVYGVAALVFRPLAIQKLYHAKLRDLSKAIPILIGDPQDLDLVAIKVSPSANRLAARFWPGALTLVVPRHPALPEQLSPYPTIGVRMPNHAVALALLRRSGPLAVTSANISGAANANTAQEVMNQLGGRIACVLDGGQTTGGLPSTVVDCSGPEPVILRCGPITVDMLTEYWEKKGQAG